MRPRYLEIEGLQSFKTLESIDFDKLSETGLFGIFGPTGSGKSTILDAVTLALYGNVQRASRGTQGIINTDMNTMRVTFTFDLTKGRARKTYKVERVYRRKKDSENGVEGKLARLTELMEEGGVVLADKQGEVNEAVIGLLGLSFDDFTRSVVLPQNKFQEFLLSQKAEKTKMLERIFYLEEYGKRLTEKVAGKLAVQRRRLAAVQGAMTVLGDASEETLKKAEADMLAAQARRQEADAGLAEAETRYGQAKEIWDIQLELEKIREAEGNFFLKEEVYKEWKSTYDRALQAEGLAERIAGYRKAADLLKTAEAELAEVKEALGRITAHLEAVQRDYDAKSRRARERLPVLAAYKARLLDAQGLGKDITELGKKLEGLRQRYGLLKREIEEKRSGIAGKKAELAGIDTKIRRNKIDMERLKTDSVYRNALQQGIKLEEMLKHAEKNRAASLSQRQALKERTAALEAELEHCSRKGAGLADRLKNAKEDRKRLQEARPADKNGLMQEEARLFQIRSQLDTLKAQGNDAALLEQKRMKQMEIQVQLKVRLEKLNAFFEENTRQTDALRAEMEKERKRYSRHAAYLLSRELRDQEPCPVCGAVIHPSPASGISGCDAADGDAMQPEERLEQLQLQLQTLEQEARERDSERIKLQEQHKQSMLQQAEIEDDLARRTAECEAERMKLPEAFRTPDGFAAETALEAAKAALTKKRRAAEEWERQLEALDESIAKLEEARTAQQVEESARRSTLEANRLQLEQGGKTLQEAETAYEEKLEAYKAFATGLGIADVRSELERIRDNDQQYEKLQSNTSALEGEAAACRDAVEALSASEQQLAREQADVDAEGRSLREQQDGLKAKYEGVLAGKDPATELEGVEKAAAEISGGEQAASEALKEAKSRHDTAAVRHSVLENQQAIYKKSVTSETASLQKALNEKGFSSAEAAESALLETASIEKLKQDIEDYENGKKKLEAQKTALAGKLGGRHVTQADWEQVRTAFDDSKTERDNSIAWYESTKNNFDVLKSKYETWKSLDRELKQHTQKEQTLVLIQKLLKGNSFIEFISEERLRYIAREASETLETLTKQRYGLELDTENGFVICDNANGGVRRAVTTLSGGETFLTSLSLALALSSQIQLKGQSPLEFFFLDEGFGTLDSRLLDAVVDALERLSTTKRVIGLISHVPELKNRMARRLIVNAPASDSSGSSVRIEKA